MPRGEEKSDVVSDLHLEKKQDTSDFSIFWVFAYSAKPSYEGEEGAVEVEVEARAGEEEGIRRRRGRTRFLKNWEGGVVLVAARESGGTGRGGGDIFVSSGSSGG